MVQTLNFDFLFVAVQLVLLVATLAGGLYMIYTADSPQSKFGGWQALVGIVLTGFACYLIGVVLVPPSWHQAFHNRIGLIREEKPQVTLLTKPKVKEEAENTVNVEKPADGEFWRVQITVVPDKINVLKLPKREDRVGVKVWYERANQQSYTEDL